MVNPYESPMPSEAKPNRRGKYFFRGLAVVFWLLGLAILWVSWQVINEPLNIERREAQPVRFSLLASIAFILPAIGFTTLGIASWQRVRWKAILGVAAFLRRTPGWALHQQLVASQRFALPLG